ncbi:MAG: hypothetical protein WD077_09900 [Bacteroidia bacterium]
MKKLLFHPFEIIAGRTALIAGLLAILLTGALCIPGNLHLDGVVDVHYGAAAPAWFFIVQGFINWLSLAVLLLVAGKIVSRTAFRAIDVFGTTAFARWPFLIIALTALAVPAAEVQQYVEHTFMDQGPEPGISAGHLVLFAVHLLLTIVLVVWAMVLSYRGYAVSCNVCGTRGIISFLIALFLAEVLSKFLFYLLKNQFLMP